MYINREIAEPIVTETMKIIQKNVNIMNERGIIIASGNKERIGTYHEGASIVLKTGRTIEIDLSYAQKLKGTKPGINMPIEIDNKIVGVVGVTGPPDEIRSYTRLVKMTAELMIKQNILTEELRLSTIAKERFLNDLLNGYFDEEEESIIYRGKVFGVDLSLPRIAIIISIKKSQYQDHSTVITEEAERERFIKEIKILLNNSKDIVGSNIRNTYFILKHINPEKPWSKELKYKLKQIKEYIQNKPFFSVKIGVGDHHRGLHGLYISYKEALKAIQIGETFKKEFEILHINDLTFEELLSSIPLDARGKFIRKTLREILKEEHLINTLNLFLENGLKICKTAKAAHLHRNTVSNHLYKIKELTGKNPFDFYEALQLSLAIRLSKHKV